MPIVDYNFPFYDKIEEHDIQNLFNNLNENYQNLILVPVNGDKSLYRYDENDSTVTIQFILNDPMNLFTHIIITDNEEFTETYKISDITISPNILSVELNVPCSFVLYAMPCIYDDQLEDIVKLDVQPCKFYVFDINSLNFQPRGISTPFWEYSFGQYYNPTDYEDYFEVVYYQKFSDSEIVNPVRFYSISDNGYKCIFEGGGYPCPGDHIVMKHLASQEIVESIYTIQNYLTITNDLDYPFYIGFNLTSDISLDNKFMESVDDGETWFPVTEESYQVESQLSAETGKYTILLAGINNTSIFGTEIFFGRFDNGNPVTDNLEINVSGNLASLGNCNDLTVLEEAREFFWSNSTQLKSVESLIIPARVSCVNTFCGCASLISTPILDFTGMDSVPQNGFGQFFNMFASCTSLTTCSIEFPPIHYSHHACQQMFYGCTSLTTLPRIEVSGADVGAFDSMFENCSSIRLAESQDSTYSTAYTITATTGSSVSSFAFTDMFKNTGGTFTGTPVLGTTYYTSNTVTPSNIVIPTRGESER